MAGEVIDFLDAQVGNNKPIPIIVNNQFKHLYFYIFHLSHVLNYYMI